MGSRKFLTMKFLPLLSLLASPFVTQGVLIKNGPCYSVVEEVSSWGTGANFRTMSKSLASQLQLKFDLPVADVEAYDGFAETQDFMNFKIMPKNYLRSLAEDKMMDIMVKFRPGSQAKLKEISMNGQTMRCDNDIMPAEFSPILPRTFISNSRVYNPVRSTPDKVGILTLSEKAVDFTCNSPPCPKGTLKSEIRCENGKGCEKVKTEEVIEKNVDCPAQDTRPWICSASASECYTEQGKAYMTQNCFATCYCKP